MSMYSMVFRSYLRSISMINLSVSDDNPIDIDESPLAAHSNYRNDKHNLSSINEQKRELVQRLKEFSDLTQRFHERKFDIELPQDLPELNLAKLQGTVSKEIYQQQSAMWELLVTEQNFLKQIQFIVEVYISVFEKLTKTFFPKINVSDVFSNLKEVYRVSLEFWKECMHPMLKELAYSQSFLQSHFLKDGFIKIGDILEPYILYCTEISKCRSYILTLEKGNELFSEYTKWAMEFEESNREMLCDHLAKPFQRLTKYKILLQAIQKYSSVDERANIQEMIDAVDVFVTRVNEKVEEKTLLKKLYQLANQIDSYDVIDPIGDDILPIVNQFNKFDLSAPIYISGKKIIRQLIHQGEIKLREGISKTSDVRLYLFTDILLITKPKKKTFGKMKIIKSPLILDKIRVHKISNNAFACICLNEFNCISSLHHFSNGDSKKIDEWLQRLEDAVTIYSHLRPNHSNANFTRDFQTSIPKVKVVQSSPKQNRYESQSSTDNENCIDLSKKRKTPTERRQTNQRDSLTTGDNISLASLIRERKNSQPLARNSHSGKMQRISKSNSFHESLNQLNDNLDISECYGNPKMAMSIVDLDRDCQSYIHTREIHGDATNASNNDFFSKPAVDSVFKEEDILQRVISRSLNKLNY